MPDSESDRECNNFETTASTRKDRSALRNEKQKILKLEDNLERKLLEYNASLEKSKLGSFKA